ncbi:MAG: hypothetical protein COA50_03195 [Flavobacteriaceae bacterium]|nr:MAG: hypothetical protein COA50_03195 [Flavobacteriaceae bacterium]
MDTTLSNGTIKSGSYSIKDMTLGWATKTKIISRKTKKRYSLEEIESLMMFVDLDTLFYKIIQTKKYIHSKKTSMKLGQVGFRGNNIELFYVSEYIYQGGAITPITTIHSYHHRCLKKKNDEIAYNMGYMYGAGQRGIKKRVREFFTDYLKLVQNVATDEISKNETMEIAMFYENNCGK